MSTYLPDATYYRIRRSIPAYKQFIVDTIEIRDGIPSIRLWGVGLSWESFTPTDQHVFEIPEDVWNAQLLVTLGLE